MLADELQLRNLRWRKATRSTGNGACVEVTPAMGRVAVRDSKNPSGGILLYSATAWQSFLAEAKGSAVDTLRP
jgi:hypothetical protein